MNTDMLSMLYATYIISGDKAFTDVPKMLRPQVKEILEREGLGHLAK